MQSQAQMAYWQKDSKIAIQNYNSYLPSVMDFTLYEATTKHSTKTMAVGTKG
jgi:predicted Zn-dependent protease